MCYPTTEIRMDSRFVKSVKRYALRFRKARFKLFEQIVAGFGREVRILDVGGFEAFWETMGFDLWTHHLTVINVPDQATPARHSNVVSVVGDGTDMHQFKRGDFDIVFSNSVIEHVGDFESQRRMAAEVQRLSDTFFIQTPNYYFPIEPHFHVPYFQMMPLGVRAKLIENFQLGCMPRVPDKVEARRLAETTRLLSRREMTELFPAARIEEERVAGLTKSLIALRSGAT